MALTEEEESKFTAEQLAELKRMAASKLDGSILDNEDVAVEGKKAFRDKQVDKLSQRPAEQLKARVNIDGVSDVVQFSSDNNYTAEEQKDIQNCLKFHRSKWGEKIPRMLAHAKAMRAEGVKESVIALLLENSQ